MSFPTGQSDLNFNRSGDCNDGFVTFELMEKGSTTTLKPTNTVLQDFPDDVPEFERESRLAGWQYFIGQNLRAYSEKW